MEDYYEDEPITKNAVSSIDDFYNFMHLLKSSWLNKKYRLKMENSRYNIYDNNNNLSAWIGIKGKCDSIIFILFAWSKSKLYKKPLNSLMDQWLYMIGTKIYGFILNCRLVK